MNKQFEFYQDLIETDIATALSKLTVDQKCVISYFFKINFNKYITKNFHFAQLHYQL